MKMQDEKTHSSTIFALIFALILVASYLAAAEERFITRQFSDQNEVSFPDVHANHQSSLPKFMKKISVLPNVSEMKIFSFDPSKVTYFLHLHKTGGSTTCKSLKDEIRNPRLNCNVPYHWWLNDDTNNTENFGPYFGNTIEKQREILTKIKEKGWRFAGNEGALEDEFPLLPEEFNYVTILREPVSLMRSFYTYEKKGKHYCDEWERHYNETWAKDNFMTRRLCGYACVHAGKMTERHFAQARANLMKFDVVLITDKLNEGLCLINQTGASDIFGPSRRSFSSRKNNFGVDCDSDFKQRIRNDYWADAKLYDLARNLFEDNLKHFPSCENLTDKK